MAILSRVGLDDVVPGSPARPGFPHPEARAVAATCGGIRVHSVYVPNGREPDSDHYRYKLAWLAALREVVAAGPEAAIVCGDMNIAPTDADVFDPDAYIGQTHVTPPERQALAELQALGLHDVVRDRWPTERVFSYWDYRAGMFHQDLGMRIDLVLAGDAGGRPRAGGLDRPPGAQGQGAERPRAGDRRPRRGAGRRHRAGRAAAVRTRSPSAARRSCHRARGTITELAGPRTAKSPRVSSRPVPDIAALKSAARAAIVMPAVFALADKVIGQPQTSIFAAFGSFAMLVLVEFTGTPRTRLSRTSGWRASAPPSSRSGRSARERLARGAGAMAIVGFVVALLGRDQRLLRGGQRPERS